MKKIISILILFLLVGCSQEKVTLKKDVIVEFYTVTTCAQCKIFKKKGIPYLEKRFGNKITVNIYDIDDEKNTDQYDQVIKSLDNFDEEYYGMSPFINIKGYIAYLGYNSGDEEYIAKDIEAVINGGNLNSKLEGHRFKYKED